jgi:glutaminyl-tRNA synthetase
MAVLDPIKIVFDNWSAEPLGHVEISNHPQNPQAGERQVPISGAVWIERDDFMEDPPKKFYRLGPGRHVRLRGGHIIRHTSHEKDATGNITLIHAEILPGTVGTDSPTGIECRAAIHWVDAATGVDAEARLYDRLFSVEDPDAAEGGFTSVLNPTSLTTVTAKIEPALAQAKPGFACQFERVGYFIADSIDHQPGSKPVFNRTVALKDSWGKQAGR